MINAAVRHQSISNTWRMLSNDCAGEPKLITRGFAHFSRSAMLFPADIAAIQFQDSILRKRSAVHAPIELSIEGFRGINNEGAPLAPRIKPDHVNSVSAGTGVCKTSIFDAVVYAIIGCAPKLEDLPAPEKAPPIISTVSTLAGRARSF